MLKVIKYYKIWFLFSGVLVAASLVLLFTWGLRAGIDLAGGSLSELQFVSPIETAGVRQELLAQGFLEVIVQPVNEKTAIIKTEALSGESLENFRKILRDKFGEFEELRFESIGPALSSELVKKAYLQIFLVALGILVYITYAFRKTAKIAKKANPSSWKLGVAAIIALLHDILITIGLFVILGKFRGVEIDSLFITALLTILGFSVHDTIVVFDRIRENLEKHVYDSLEEIIDYSVNSTLARSINTSSTLIFVLIAMLLFGGQTIYYFVLALLVGVVVGTYSSIFIASPILYIWQKRLTR